MSRLSKFLRDLRTAHHRFINRDQEEHSDIHFSQYGEDIILRGYFPVGYKGFYVDAGALHPFRFSNTALFHRAGWTGINIEPSVQGYREFCAVRPLDINVCVAVGKETGSCTYQFFKEPAFNRLKSTTLRLEQTAGAPKPLGECTVPVEPLRSILSTYLPAGRVIDILSVDCEGVDLEVLESNDWTAYLPRLVCVEDWQPLSSSEIVRFLTAKGYAHVGQTHNTRILRHESFTGCVG